MIALVENIITRMESGHIITKKGDRYSPATLKNFKNIVPWLEYFEAENGRQESVFNTSDFFVNLKVFLTAQGLAKNSVAVMLQNLHAILRHEKAFSLLALDNVKTEMTTAVYTTIAELEFLSSLDLSETPGYDRVRDAYIMQCSVGLRFRDFKRVMSAINMYIVTSNNREYFKLKTAKAQEDVVIPVNSAATKILKKRSYDFGEMFSLQYYNSGIKWLGHRAGFTEPVCKNITKGGRMTQEFYEKWQLMGSHTARRSFATNAILAGLSETDVMKIGGWKSVAAFRRYLRADQLLSARSLAEHPFFK